ncbi:hypothetical protein LIER_25987 [Lithospermum erythrorhizon]|uniref:non-specific serine/threonine protein kinase n=1 Tax=Lithospermum erythrorhizon TaxID=34254 RepID=A0AAV3R8V3_LITER
MNFFLGFVCFVVLLAYVNGESESSESDALAMQDLKKSWKAGSSLGWSDEDPCNWKGVGCDKHKRVTRIQVGDKGLNGFSVPQSLSNLTSLQIFEVQKNNLIGSLPNLKGLNSLQRILVNENNFTSIPPDFFSGMSGLVTVSLDNNPFSSWGLPESLKDCSSLYEISANSVNIGGQIPDFLNSSNFPCLANLHLGLNSLEGELPASFGGDSFLSLWLNGQKLNGTLRFLQNMTKLKEVWLHGNSFTGALPDFSGFTQLEKFSVRDNSLTGLVPESLVKLSTLISVNLTGNMLQGQTPNFATTVEVDMISDSNCFCLNFSGAPCDDRVNLLLDVAKGVGYPGVFAQSWKGNDPCKGNWRGISCNNNGNITVLTFWNMGLIGTISQAFSKIDTLESLNLANNSLFGTIPYELTSLPRLKSLDLSNNMICGEIPTFRSNVTVKTGGNVNLGKECPSTPGGGGDNSQTGGKKPSSGVIAGAVVGGIIAVIMFVGLVVYFLHRTKHHCLGKEQGQTTWLIHPWLSASASDQEAVKLPISGWNENGQPSGSHSVKSGPSDLNLGGSDNLVISIHILRAVTNNFNTENILGKGGFGTVYKGELHDGTKIAVKRMESGVMGEKGLDEFTSEIAVLTRVRHRHLVALLGYCLDGNERLLVYEYMHHGTLSEHLFNWKDEGLKPLEWTKRLTIALDVARGVEYLHSLAQQSFIHRDLKPSNILLGDDMRAKVSDFGLVRLVPDGKASLVTKLAGTFGYLAPEYAVTGRVTTKVDVYSFGVILMEMITGRRALDQTQPEESTQLVSWFRRMLIEINGFHKAIDPSIDVDEATYTSINTVAELARHCTTREPHQRPEMSHVVNVLSSLAEFWKPSEPDEGDIYGINCDMSLSQAVQRWQALDGMTGIDSSSSYLANIENTQTSIPMKPSGFANSFSSTAGR